MRPYLRVFVIELKRATKSIPQLLLGAIVLSFLIGTIAFCSGQFLYEKQSDHQIKIAMVLQDSTQSMDWVDKFISNTKESSPIFTFLLLDEKEAYAQLDREEISAIMIIPDNVFDKIISGENEPIKVILPSTSTLEAVLLQELTKAGAKTLSSAQAGIYAISDLYIMEDVSSFLEDAFMEINVRNLQYALARDELFDLTTTTITNNISPVLYYTASGILLFLLLWGTSYCHFFERSSTAFYDKLYSYGVRTPGYVFIKYAIFSASYFIIFGVLSLFISWLYSLLTTNTNDLSWLTGSTILRFLYILLVICSFIMMIYELAPTATSGVLLLFISSILLLLLSGAFIPLGFFPDYLRQISMYLPTSLLMTQLLALVTQDTAFPGLISGSLYLAGFLLIAMYAHDLRRKIIR